MKCIHRRQIVLAVFGLSVSTLVNAELTSKIIPIAASDNQIAKSKVPRIELAHAELTPDLSGIKIFTTDNLDTLPKFVAQGVFDCVGSIHLGVSFSARNYDLRNSAIEVRWFNPDGGLEMASNKPDYRSFGGTAFRSVGIRLNRPQGGGLFSLFDHSAGMGRFIGQWQSELWIAGEKIKTVHFDVQC